MLVRRLLGASLLAAAFLSAPAFAVADASPTPLPAARVSQPAPTLVAFRSRFGFGRGYGYGRYGGYGSYGRSRHSFLRRVAKTAFWLYVLHLFFSHGGLSILLWILIIAVVMSLLRRRRRRLAY